MATYFPLCEGIRPGGLRIFHLPEWMGLSPYHSYPLESEASLDQAVAELNAARDSDERYSGVRFMSLAALKPLVTKLLWSGKANNLTYEVRRLLRFTVSENTIILWHEPRRPRES